MNILTFNFGSFTHYDLLIKLKEMGYTYKNIDFFYERNNADLKYHYDEFEQLLINELQSNFDCVITTNFYPIIAKICHQKNVKYLAWSYDSPINLPCTDEMEHLTNFIFLFDKNEVKKYQAMGFDNFYHLPLAVNCDRLDLIHPCSKYETDISFMGQLYESILPVLERLMLPYQQELIDKLISTQLNIYGNWFIDDVLTDNIVNDINRHLLSQSTEAIQISKQQLSYALAQHITHIERITLLNLFHKMGYKVDLYTYDLSENEKELLKGINVHGKLSYQNEMPQLFKSSKINLNPTLKNITSGISLRALDIIGSKGFLLANYQPEIAEYFKENEEIVMYSSMEDALEKASFYLEHDDLRNKITMSGYNKIRENFNYENRISKMFETAKLLF